MMKTRTLRYDKARRGVDILLLLGLFYKGLGRGCRAAQCVGSSSKSLSCEVNIGRESAGPGSPKTGRICRCWGNVTITLRWDIGCQVIRRRPRRRKGA